MRNLFLFIWRNYIVFLFLLLEVLSFYLIIKNNKYQNTGFFNTSNNAVGNIYNVYSSITGYINLKNSNEQLAAENAKLLSLTGTVSLSENDSSEITKTDTLLKQKYVYLEAKVINNSINRRNNYLTLDKGSLHGIEAEMAVIAPDGVVGIVKDVSENFCSVMSLLNKNTNISSKHKKTGYLGILVWNGGDPTVANLNDVPKNATIAIGDTIISSGASAIFPEGIAVGTIQNFELVNGANFYNIEMKLAPQLGKLSYVYVIKNLMKEEQRELETRSQNDN